jgi:hypothetical protein
MNSWNAKTANLDRRMLLRGLGVALALPWLESVPVWGDPAKPGEPASRSPKRFAGVFMGNGINHPNWWAKGSGAEMQLGRCLQPLAALKTKLNVIDGLYNKAATGVGIHPGMTGNVLSGAPLQKGAELKAGISIDQVMANHLGGATVQPSMVLGCEQPTTGYHETNFSLAYSSHISWQNATSPVPMEVYPSLAFDALFDNRGAQRMRSVLDRVKEDAASLSLKLSAADRAKLDEYLTSVREVEKRVDPTRAAKQSAEEKTRGHGAAAVAAMPRPQNGMPEDLRDHMKLMCDILALGFQTDKTRVATLLLCRDLSGLTYPFLNVRAAHHPASHSDTSEDYERITTYYVTQFAYLGTRLESMKEADGTVLDRSAIMFISNMWSGSRHDNSKLPLLLLGGLGGTLKTGRSLDYFRQGNDSRKLCSLYLSLLHCMDVSTDRFGDANTPLKDL